MVLKNAMPVFWKARVFEKQAHLLMSSAERGCDLSWVTFKPWLELSQKELDLDDILSRVKHNKTESDIEFLDALHCAIQSELDSRALMAKG